MEDRLPRKLAAILYADVVGYSRLTGDDEEGTHRRLREYLDLVSTSIRRHQGNVVHYAGDAVLAEFGTVTEALTSATDIQAELAKHNQDLPSERKVEFRIGVNLGEVIVDRDDIYGDGVNIAARLEALADPAGICISDAVRTAVGKKLDLTYEDMGERQVKNIESPVRAYRVVMQGQEEPVTPSAQPPSFRRPDKPSIAVLPFTNMSGDSEQEYFSDGITEDLITALAKSRHLSVIARNSTFVYKGRSVKVEDVGRELGTQFVLEGSVRKGGNKVRVTAQLIDVETGAHIWAERFDRELVDIFTVQDEIVTTIAVQLGFSLIDSAVASDRGRSVALLTAYDHVLRGRASWRRGAAIETRDHYLNAVEADPNFATSLGLLAFIYAYDTFMQLFGLPTDEEARLARHYAERAVARDDGDPMLHHALGSAFLCLGEHDKAKHYLELAHALNPHNPYSYINLSCTIVCMGEHQKGLAMIEEAFWLEPRMAPAIQQVLLFCHYIAQDYESAISDFPRIDNPFAYFFLILAACFAQLNRTEDSRRAMAEFESRRPVKFDVEGFVEVVCGVCRLPEDIQQVREGFRKAGLIS